MLRSRSDESAVSWQRSLSDAWKHTANQMQSKRRNESEKGIMERLSTSITEPIPRSVVIRRDGRHALEPMVCSVKGSRSSCLGRLERSDIQRLHNEGAWNADAYPLRAQDGLFFTESLSDHNPTFERYQNLIKRSLDVLVQRDERMSFRDLEICGAEIQKIDAAFASELIGQPLDTLHACVGPDPSHPYSKLTVCRTTFPVDVKGEVFWFFFEKFLVSYSFIDSDGKRRSTRTPIHSHPMNFETVYFVSHGPTSRAVEQEFRLLTESGDPVVRPDGSLDAAFLRRLGSTTDLRPCIEPGEKSEIRPSDTPTRLTAFDSELALRNHDDLIVATDGLFRPHQVTVVDDPQRETRYFALDNYFGPVGRVLLYGNDGKVEVWSHDAWDH